jgi:hypothetical protein
VTFKPEGIGIYQIAAGSERYSLASNALRKEESDLTGTASGRWGSLDDVNSAERELLSITWIFLLMLMLVLLIHLVLVSRGIAATQR